jgi:hypothetical protein
MAFILSPRNRCLQATCTLGRERKTGRWLLKTCPLVTWTEAFGQDGLMCQAPIQGGCHPRPWARLARTPCILDFLHGRGRPLSGSP